MYIKESSPELGIDSGVKKYVCSEEKYTKLPPENRGEVFNKKLKEGKFPEVSDLESFRQQNPYFDTTPCPDNLDAIAQATNNKIDESKFAAKDYDRYQEFVAYREDIRQKYLSEHITPDITPAQRLKIAQEAQTQAERGASYKFAATKDDVPRPKPEPSVVRIDHNTVRYYGIGGVVEYKCVDLGQQLPPILEITGHEYKDLNGFLIQE